MKKVLALSLCALLCAALISCEKEKPGVYNPKKKIQKVYKDLNGEKVLDQVWSWDGKLLSKIDYYYEGAVWYTDEYFYDSKNRISRLIEEDDHLDFIYENDRIKNINYYWIDELMESFTMYYDNNKLSKIEWVGIEVQEGDHVKKLNPLAGLIPQGCEVFEKAVSKMRSQQKWGDAKLIMELTWEGKNVSHIVAYIEGDPEDITETSFTYDNKVNPLRGWHTLWMDYVIGVWDDELYTYSSYGNVLTADYVCKYEGEMYDRFVTNYIYEYDEKYPVKVTATNDGEPYFTRYYEY